MNRHTAHCIHGIPMDMSCPACESTQEIATDHKQADQEWGIHTGVAPFVEVDRKADGLFAIANAIGTLTEVLSKQLIVATAHPNEAVKETCATIAHVTEKEAKAALCVYRRDPQMNDWAAMRNAIESFARSRGLL